MITNGNKQCRFQEFTNKQYKVIRLLVIHIEVRDINEVEKIAYLYVVLPGNTTKICLWPVKINFNDIEFLYNKIEENIIEEFEDLEKCLEGISYGADKLRIHLNKHIEKQ